MPESRSPQPPAVEVDAEKRRLDEDAQRAANWKRWGPYLSERQWGTVREDYSSDGNAWDYFPHDHARSRAYRWGEDGLLGFTDRECRICFALALWNEKDPILKERLFGLTGPQGNHGEDVKESYFYVDATPTYSYAKALYKYPQRRYPYEWLTDENGRRGRHDPEFELDDTGAFAENRYWDVTAEYAKAAPDDLLIRLTIANRGPEAATLHLLPTLWLRNSWAWGCTHEGCDPKGTIVRETVNRRGLPPMIRAEHPTLGAFRLIAENSGGYRPDLLFTENETNRERIFGEMNVGPLVKDGFHRYLIDGDEDAVSVKGPGTKAAFHYRLEVPAGEEVVIRLRLWDDNTWRALATETGFGRSFDATFERRIAEADAFYAAMPPDPKICGESNLPAAARVLRQAYAGLLWSKQFYHISMADWLEGDPNLKAPPGRKNGRNREWRHFFSRDILSMPDKWEYPWFAAWDTAFHMIVMARVDPDFAKNQMLLLLREWYMHPNGQIPAYEWAFGDVNPPTHIGAVWAIYQATGGTDRLFLERAFQKMLLNFTWWVNRKDADGRNVFGGGFLGMDNVTVFDRSAPLGAGEQLDQADGTAWMAYYCLLMLVIALELASRDPAYEDMASKFFEHYVSIVDAISGSDGGEGLWDRQDGFFYDQLLTRGRRVPIRLRSAVGLIPLMGVDVLDQSIIDLLPGFQKRFQWFLSNRPDLAAYTSYREKDSRRLRLLSIPSPKKLKRILQYVLDEKEFLSDFGIRSLSKRYEEAPYQMERGSNDAAAWIAEVRYTPGESDIGLYGGNSNWRGPIWFPINLLIVQALERYYEFYGDDFTVECPTGSGVEMTLMEVAIEISRRLAAIFLPGTDGRSAWQGGADHWRDDPHWRDLTLFHEYFHGDTGQGLGASHQTGWTALIALLLEGTHFTGAAR